VDYKTLFERTKDLSLLLVEDYEPLRNDMAEVLEDLFETVVVASNGVEALGLYDEYSAAHQKSFDIVISDIEMPLMNGVDLCEILRQRDEEQQIIILSAHTDSEYLLRLINLGIAQFINKPIQHERLLNTLFFVSGKVNKEEKAISENSTVDLGEDTFWDKERDILIQNRYPVSLTKHEILLMQLLVEKADQVCTSDKIMQQFYLQGIDLSEKNIRNMVFKLRKKLPPAAIESIYGMGYKLIPVK
jgi:DNA-binding response OmpR family regulator